MDVVGIGSHECTIQLLEPVFNFMSLYCTVESPFWMSDENYQRFQRAFIGKSISQIFTQRVFWFYFNTLHAVWVWHLYYLEACWIAFGSKQNLQSTVYWLQHLEDLCRHMFSLSVYSSAANVLGCCTVQTVSFLGWMGIPSDPVPLMLSFLFTCMQFWR